MQSRCEKEKTRQRLQVAFDAQQSPDERNRLGQFATPLHLARQIVSVALTYQHLPVEEIRFLEPAIGTGAFYSAFLDAVGGTVPEHAVGFETDAQLASISRGLWGEAGLEVRNDDFTLSAPPSSERKKFNLLVTNPPYVRHHHLTTAKKNKLRELIVSRLSVRPSGLMGLYGYFILLSHDWMQADGVASWLVPTEFMDVGYGSMLRKYLATEVQLLRVHRFQAKDGQFPDADVTSTVVFLRKRIPAPDDKVIFTVGSDIESPRIRDSVPLYQLRQIHKWTSIGERPLGEILEANNQESSGLTIGDLFCVKRGLATGANSFFIMSPGAAEERGIPRAFLRPILPSPRHLRGKAVIESDVSGAPLIEPSLLLLDCSLPKDQIARKYGDLYRYILKGEREGLHQRYLLSRRAPWYRQEERAPAPIVCQYMGRRRGRQKSIRFYRNKSQAVATNVYLMLYPKPAILKRCEHAEAFLDHVFDLLRSLDNHDVCQHGRTYGGGLEKIEPGELPRVLLPQVKTVEDVLRAYSQLRLL